MSCMQRSWNASRVLDSAPVVGLERLVQGLVFDNGVSVTVRPFMNHCTHFIFTVVHLVHFFSFICNAHAAVGSQQGCQAIQLDAS
jgi:hypothetical protein